MFKSFERNTRGRDFAVGDVHGHFSALQALLEKVDFNPAVDRLFSVGDLVDRGPESPQVLDWLKKPWFHAAQGNHEDMAIRWPEGNMPPANYAANGGGWNINRTPEQQREMSDALARLPIAMEVDVGDGALVGIVHAECPSDDWAYYRNMLQNPFVLSMRMREGLADMSQWSRVRIDSLDESIVRNVSAVLVGHTPVKRFTSLGNTFFCDTGGWLPKDGCHFTLVDLKTMRPAATYSTRGLLDWAS